MIGRIASTPSLDQIQDAHREIRGIAVRTPLVRFDATDPRTLIFLKLENLQPSGAFKTRGATYAMRRTPRVELARGVVTASAGNMARAVAWSAREIGARCTVVAPDTAPAVKLDAVRSLGANVITVPFDRWWQTLLDRAYPGVEGVFIHPFDDVNVMAGNGTIALEIIEDMPEVDTVLVPWGGGGLSLGIAAGMRALKPSCRVMAVEVEGGAPLAASLQVGQPVEVDYRPTFVDGIGSRTVMPEMLELASRHLAGSLVARVDEVAAAVRQLAEHNHVVSEGAGAAALAVARSGRAGHGAIACIVSGGNIDSHKLAVILEGGVP